MPVDLERKRKRNRERMRELRKCPEFMEKQRANAKRARENESTEARERRLSKLKDWRESNKERRQEYKKKWVKDNRSHVREMQKKYWQKYKHCPEFQLDAFERQLAFNYGIGICDYLELWDKQEGKCAICKIDIVPRGLASNSAVVDHCHLTGNIRGILCSPCNVGLGSFKDSAESLSVAILYLNRSIQP